MSGDEKKKKDIVDVRVKCTFYLEKGSEEILREIKRCVERLREAIKQAIGTDDYEISEVEIESVEIKIGGAEPVEER